jgi:hypothetical protein
MVDGLWIVQYEGTQGEGAGVVVLVNGRVLGGDYGYTYEGNYVVKDGWIAISVHCANFLPNVPTVLGVVADFDFEMRAPITDRTVQGTLSVVGKPELAVAVRLTKRADL